MLYSHIVDGKCEKSACRPEFDMSCALLVAGLGTAGAMAAISGAEAGLDTIGVDALGAMGGLGTIGGVWDYAWGNSGGRFEALDRRAQRLCDSAFMHTGMEEDELGSRFIHGAAKAYVLEDAARKAGCRLLLNASVTGVFMEGDRIIGVECFTASGRICIAAKIVIDSTGDQIVVRSAGFPTRTEADAARMNFTRTRAEIVGTLVRNAPTSCGQRTSELRDDFTLSERLVEVGSKPPFLCERYDAENRTVIVGETPGYRDAERIVGLDTLKLIPYLRGEFSKAPLFYAFAPIDHVGGDLCSASFGQQLWWLGCKMRAFGIAVPVTAGMMIPSGSRNLIVADKGLSVDDALTGCLRMKKDMQRLGEAAGKLACFAIKENRPVPEVDISAVRRTLCEDGLLYERASIICKLNGFMDWRPFCAPKTLDELRDLLASPDFGAAVVFALAGQLSAFDDAFESMLSQGETRDGAAILLGILALFGRSASEDVYAALRQIAQSPIADRSVDPDRLPQAAAIWILGELRDNASLSLIKALEAGFSARHGEPADRFLASLSRAAARMIEEEI